MSRRGSRHGRVRLTALIALCTLSVLPTLSAGQVAAEAPTKLASVEGIDEYRLENGMQVLLFHDPSKPTVTVNVTYFVGSRHEGRGEKGMAHLLEHMVFKGTPNNPEIWVALEDHGANFNGTTWVDRTNYYETLPSEPGNLEFAISMEADRMVNSHIAAEDLATEFSVVRNEFEMGENDPTSVLWERMMSAAYQWHNYGDTTIGSRSDIERVPIANLQAFYRKYYQPDNAMLVVAGDFDRAETLALIQKHFGAIPRPQRVLEDSYTIEPPQDGAHHVDLRRVGDVAAVGTTYHIPPAAHEDFAAVEIVAQILSDEPSGRLYKSMVESGKASGVFGVAFGWREPGVMISIAQVPTDQSAAEALQTMISTIEGLGTTPVTDEEIARARRSLLKDIELSMKNSGRIGVELSEWASAGDWRLMFLHRDRLERVTAEQIRAVAARYFLESNRTSGIFHPQRADQTLRAEVPQAPDIAALVSDYKGREALAEGEEFEATPQNIESRVARSKLSNGMQLAMLPKQTRGDAVNAVLTLRFATPEDLEGRTTAVAMIPSMLMRGSKAHSYQAIQDRLDELKASVNMGGGGFFGGPGNSLDVSIRTDHQNLGDVLDLVYEILRNPTFPASEFEIVKKERIAELEEQLSDPQARAFNYLSRSLSPYPQDDVRYVPTLEESLERWRAVKREDLEKFHRDFYGASHAQMTIVGDFDPQPISTRLDAGLGQWKSAKAYRRIAGEYTPSTGHEHTILTPDKQMAMVACGVGIPIRDDDPAYPALHLSNYVLGASAKSRLLDRLRQKEGLSYGTGSFLVADSQDQDGLFAGMAISAPQNAKQAEASLFDEFRRLISDGIPTAELEDAKASFAQQTKGQLSNDRAVADMINEGLYLGRTMEYYEKLYRAIDELTSEQVNKALAKYVDPERMVRVRAGDLEGGS